MKAMRIQGGRRLSGTIAVSGAKNAALPMLAAALLSDDPIELSNVPQVKDVASMGKLLGLLGVDLADLGDGRLRLTGGPIEGVPTAPYEVVRTMRASVLVLGPLLVRHGRAVVSLPGGCAIGARPIDQHLMGLEALGARIEVDGGYVRAECDRLRGTRIRFAVPTVGGTENLLMAASLAAGETELIHAAREPEITALADLLRAMGAEIEGDGTDTIRIQGKPSLHAGEAAVIPDRIEAGTFLMAAAATGGDVVLERVRPDHLEAVTTKLQAAGVAVEATADTLAVRAADPLRPTGIQTAPYPGYPTDLQAQWMALMTGAAGESTIEETIFENRFMHVPELNRMGANIAVDGRRAVVSGGGPLSGAPVMATDLRASAGLVIAALAAAGASEVLRIYHLERGYAGLVAKLEALGADVELFDREAAEAKVADAAPTAPLTEGAQPA